MSVIDVLTLQFLPYQLRGLVAGAVGLALFLYGAYRLVRALVDPFALWDRDQPMVEVIYQKRFLARGPARRRASGGGTGLSALLRGLKEHTSNLTAVVTVADDGGSSGVLRTELGIPAVGDIRNCIVALADAEPLMGRLLQYRFPGPEPTPAAPEPIPACRRFAARRRSRVGLGGHAVGNLLLAALVALEDGDFEEGVREMNRVLAVRGRVVPATGTVLSLHARLRDGTEVEGQSRIARSGDVDRVWVTPGGRARRATTPCGRSRMPRSSCSARAASTRASCRRSWCPGIREAIDGLRRARRVRLQRGDPGGRDRRLRPRRPRRRPRAPRRRRTCPTSCWPTTGSTRRAARGLARRAGAAPLAAGRRGERRAAPRPRRPRRPGERPPPRPGPPCRARSSGSGSARAAIGGGTAWRASGAPPDRGRCPGPSGTSSRRCARSWRPSTRRAPVTAAPRSPASARASTRGSRPSRAWSSASAATPARVGERPAGRSCCPRSTWTGRRRPSTAGSAWLRGRFLARGSLSLAAGRAHLEFVVAARRGAGPRGAPGRRGSAGLLAAPARASAS